METLVFSSQGLFWILNEFAETIAQKWLISILSYKTSLETLKHQIERATCFLKIKEGFFEKLIYQTLLSCDFSISSTSCITIKGIDVVIRVV